MPVAKGPGFCLESSSIEKRQAKSLSLVQVRVTFLASRFPICKMLDGNDKFVHSQGSSLKKRGMVLKQISINVINSLNCWRCPLRLFQVRGEDLSIGVHRC